MPTQRRRRPNMRLPCKMTSKSIFHSDPRLPTFQQRAESATPATQMKKCPVFGTCHARRRSRPQNVPKVARRPREMDIWLKKRARLASKTIPVKETKPGTTLCASLCSRNAYGHLTKELLCKNLRWTSRGPESVPWSNPSLLFLS